MYLRHRQKKTKGKSKWGHSLSPEVWGFLWVFYNNQITRTSGFNLRPSQKPSKQCTQENLLGEKNNLSTKNSQEAKATIVNVYEALNASSVLGAPPIFTTLWLIVAIPNCQENTATGCLQRLSEDRGGRPLCIPVWTSLSDGTGLSPTHRAF